MRGIAANAVVVQNTDVGLSPWHNERMPLGRLESQGIIYITNKIKVLGKLLTYISCFCEQAGILYQVICILHVLR